MKLLQSVFATAALAAFATTAAHAATTVRLTGSTAYRTAVTTAIENIMNAHGGFEAVYVGSSETATLNVGDEKGAGTSIFKGNIGNASVDPVTIKCSWAGSVGGVKILTQNLTTGNGTTWLADSTLTGTNGVTIKKPSLASYDSATTADVTMSDTRQSTTPYPTPALTATQVGVVPFVWVKGHDVPSSVTNMTALVAQQIAGNFGTPLAQLTGNPADADSTVVLVGRDQDSGTRVAAFAESGYGSAIPPYQWQVVTTNGTDGVVDYIQLYPANNVLGTTYPIGTSGYASGGNVATAMSVHGADTAGVYDKKTGGSLQFTGAYLIGYVGTGDAKNITADGSSSALKTQLQNSDGTFSAQNGGHLQVLSYNGIPYSYDNVKEGLYSFWTYEHIMWRTGASTAVKAVGAALATEVSTNTASLTGIKLGDMHSARDYEGGAIYRQ